MIIREIYWTLLTEYQKIEQYNLAIPEKKNLLRIIVKHEGTKEIFVMSEEWLTKG